MTAYVIYGTGQDKGVAGSSSVAFGLNAGGGGSGGWTGQTNATAAVISLGGVSTAGRYAAVAAIPLTANEIAVALCYTPVGTAGANDYIAFDGIQLTINDALTPFASATVGYSDAAPQVRFAPKAFDRRSQGVETAYQYRYYWQTNDAVSTQVYGSGFYYTTTECNIVMNFPLPMRAVPAVAFGGKTLDNTTFAVLNATGTTPVALATDYLTAGLAAASIYAGTLEATTAGSTAGWACDLIGAATPTTANIQWSAEL